MVITQAGRVFLLFASVAVSLFAHVANSRIIIYGRAKPLKGVLNRIEETRKAMGCNAHVLPIVVSRKARYLTINVNIRGLPARLNTTFKLDELYINIQNGGNSIPAQKTNELRIEEKNTQTLLARVPLNSSKNGYRAIKMRGVYMSWLADNRRRGFLNVKLSLTQKHLLKNLFKSKSYFVIYTYSIAGQWASPKCESFDVTIKPQIPLNTATFRTKVCSPPDEISFPFNGSSFFDMGVALRKSLKDNPIPKNAAVLRNPKCCHATKATSRIFARVEKLTIQLVELPNVTITECGCGTA